MKKLRKILLNFLSGVTAVSVSAGTLTCFAEGNLYQQEITMDTVNMYYIIGLEDDPLACYQQAKDNGVRDFILTEEGHAVYEEIMAEHHPLRRFSFSRILLMKQANFVQILTDFQKAKTLQLYILTKQETNLIK